MRLLKQICSIALSAGMVLSPVTGVMASEENVTQSATEETMEAVVSENEDAVEYWTGKLRRKCMALSGQWYGTMELYRIGAVLWNVVLH